jgi:hypothetical protein
LICLIVIFLLLEVCPNRGCYIGVCALRGGTDRERQRGTDRERDRQRGTGREERHRDRERDRWRGTGRERQRHRQKDRCFEGEIL